MAMASGGAGAAAAATAERLAEAEGLTLIPSSNACGYLGVSVCGKDGYQARIKVDGRDERIGWYPSAAEAALAYARYLGPARCAELAQRPLKRRRNPPGAQNSGFGVPQYVLPNGAGDMSVPAWWTRTRTTRIRRHSPSCMRRTAAAAARMLRPLTPA